MAFRTECDWSIHLQGDGTARHEIQLRLYDLAAALGSSVNQSLSVDVQGVYRNPQGRADGRNVRVDQQRLRDRMGCQLSLRLRDLEFLAGQAEPAIVVVSVLQEGVLNRVGAMELYLLDFLGWNPAAESSKVVVHLPRLSMLQRAVQWIWGRLRHSAYPMWAFETGAQAIRGRVDPSARKVEYTTGGRVVPGSGVAFHSRFSINIFAWFLSMLISAGIGIGVGIAAIKLAERI